MYGETDQASFIIRQCNKTIAEFLDPLLDYYAADVDAALVHAANNASSDKLCNALMDAASTLKGGQSKIRQLTLSAIAEPLKPGNAKEIFGKPDVDGGLIGGAALKAEDFYAIVNAF